VLLQRTKSQNNNMIRKKEVAHFQPEVTEVIEKAHGLEKDGENGTFFWCKVGMVSLVVVAVGTLTYQRYLQKM